MHDMILFLATTGVRPDEVKRLDYRDVEIVRDAATDQIILEISARGKRGVGFCKSMTGAVLPFQRLQPRNSPEPTDLVFLQNHKKHFNTLLDRLGFKFDREGSRRTIYPGAILTSHWAGIVIRSHNGKVDASELLSGYKSARAMAKQIEAFGLAKIVV